jgi:PhoH-like ATPase
MSKLYVLDTSVLVRDPSSFKSFPDSTVVLPITVLDELDKLKKQSTEAGKNARLAVRLLDETCKLGDISTGILLPNKCFVKIDATDYKGIGDSMYGDTRIIACAQALSDSGEEVIFLSNDINLRVRAQGLGMIAEGYDGASLPVEDIFSGVKEVIDEELAADLYKKNKVNPLHYGHYGIHLKLNECLVVKNEAGEELAYARKTKDDTLKLVSESYPWDLRPRNKEQMFAIDMMMDPKIHLVSLLGLAGGGKTLCMAACALDLILNKKQYDKIVVYKPTVSVGNELGFLPGELAAKLAPWMGSIMDSFEYLLKSNLKSNSGKNKDNWKILLEKMIKEDVLEFGAISFIRGRSIANTLIIIEECQNCSAHEMKTILTRAGEGSKIILTGDCSQIDTHQLDAINNGLTYVVEKFKEYDLAGHITFTQGERSALATLASEIL